MFGTLKNLMFESEPGDAKPSQPQAPSNQPLGQAPQVAGFAPAPSVNDHYVNALRTALKARPTAFTALLSGAEKLQKFIPDPVARFQAAFEQIKGDGRGVREIATAIDIHASDLEAQRMAFGAALDKEVGATVGALKTEAERLKPATEGAQQQIASMTEQIGKLQQLILGNQTRMNEIGAQVATEEGRIASSKQQFETALSIVKSELEGQKTVILSALA